MLKFLGSIQIIGKKAYFNDELFIFRKLKKVAKFSQSNKQGTQP